MAVVLFIKNIIMKKEHKILAAIGVLSLAAYIIKKKVAHRSLKNHSEKASSTGSRPLMNLFAKTKAYNV